MKVIVAVKEGFLGNFLSILFLLSLAAVAIWFARRREEIAPLFFAGIWILCCWIPLHNIRYPKEATLSISDDSLHWQIRATEAGASQECKIPLKTIESLEVILPSRDKLNYSLAEIVIIDIHKNKHPIPPELLPAVYRKKIISALQEAVPNLSVHERLGSNID